MDNKPREIPFENGFLTKLREQAKPLDCKVRAEIFGQAEAKIDTDKISARVRALLDTPELPSPDLKAK